MLEPKWSGWARPICFAWFWRICHVIVMKKNQSGYDPEKSLGAGISVWIDCNTNSGQRVCIHSNRSTEAYEEGSNDVQSGFDKFHSESLLSARRPQCRLCWWPDVYVWRLPGRALVQRADTKPCHFKSDHGGRDSAPTVLSKSAQKA